MPRGHHGSHVDGFGVVTKVQKLRLWGYNWVRAFQQFPSSTSEFRERKNSTEQRQTTTFCRPPPLASSSHRGEEFHVFFEGCCSKDGILTSGAACSKLLFLGGGFLKTYSSTRSDIDGTKVCGSARGFSPLSIMPSKSVSQRSAVAARARTFCLPPAGLPTSFEAPRPPPERSATDAAVRVCREGEGAKGGRTAGGGRWGGARRAGEG